MNPERDRLPDPALLNRRIREALNFGHQTSKNATSAMNTNPSSSQPSTPQLSTLHPFACPLARTFMEDRHGRLQDTPDEAAQNRWLERFGENIDLLDELFQGRLGAYPEYPGPRQP